MPFMNISLSASEDIDWIFSAGPDQNSICTLIVTLTATVVQNLAGHTILWEQISGSAVTWLTPQNQLIVQYSVVTSVDRTFRFWIDKGTAEQVFDDMTVFGTPTSTAFLPTSGSGGAGTINATRASYGNSVRIREPVLSRQALFSPAYNSAGQASCIGTSWAINWTEPESPSLITQYIIQRFLGGVWVSIASQLPSQPRAYYGVIAENIYRVIAEYNDDIQAGNGQILTQYISNSVWLHIPSLNGGAEIVGTDAIFTVRSVGTFNSMRITNYLVTLLTVDACDNISGGDTDLEATTPGNSGTFNNMTMPVYSAVQLTLDTCNNISGGDPDPEATTPGNSGTINNIRITNYVVQNLGGGSIGG